MKKIIFNFALVVAAFAFVACGEKAKTSEGQEAKDGDKTEATSEATEVSPKSDKKDVKTEDRAWYTVDIPAPWEAKQYTSEMIVKKDGAELNFKEQAKGELAKWLENLAKEAESSLDDITTGNITWKVFKNDKKFKTVYVAQVNDGVVRVGSSLEDPNDADVLKILGTVKGK